MSRFRQYTDRVTLQSDGYYCWRQDTERKYELSRLKTGFTACAIIAVFILAFGVFLSIFNGTFNGTPINYTLNDIPASIYVFPRERNVRAVTTDRRFYPMPLKL